VIWWLARERIVGHHWHTKLTTQEESMLRVQTFALAALTFIGTAAAQAATFEIDPVHTTVQFAVRHMMVSNVRGTFGKVSGTVNLDETDPAKSSVQATIDATSLDTREPKRDAHVKSADFLDVDKYPTITFKSKRVTKVADDKYQAVGDLTIHGVTKEVVLDVDGSPRTVTDPMGMVRVGGTARTKINRKDFGITWSKSLDGGGVMVGDDIDITIDVELKKGAPAA
jgi:polyisoprenoid-binding protein YceI